MAGFKRYRKDDPVSYSLGITLTFELLRYKTEYVNKVYVHSAMKEGETYDKLRPDMRGGRHPDPADGQDLSCSFPERKLLCDRRVSQV